MATMRRMENAFACDPATTSPLPAVMTTQHTLQLGGLVSAAPKKSSTGNLVYIYLSFLGVAGLFRETYAGDFGISTFLTISVGVQLFSLSCLRYRVSEQRSVRGVSQKSLIMQSLVYALRLSSSTWLKGYIPVDRTGDGLYQLLDVLCLLMALDLIRCCRSARYRDTYQEEFDTVSIQPIILGCLGFAVLLHPDLNDRPLFDTAWTGSLYIDAVAMLPQLWLMSRAGGVSAMQDLSSHYLVGVACSRMANFAFWYHAYPELAPMESEKTNWPGYAVVAAHVVQFLLLADFLWYFFVACGLRLTGGTGTAQRNGILPNGGVCVDL